MERRIYNSFKKECVGVQLDRSYKSFIQLNHMIHNNPTPSDEVLMLWMKRWLAIITADAKYKRYGYDGGNYRTYVLTRIPEISELTPIQIVQKVESIMKEWLKEKIEFQFHLLNKN